MIESNEPPMEVRDPLSAVPFVDLAEWYDLPNRMITG
jgi:hypothetical protein